MSENVLKDILDQANNMPSFNERVVFQIVPLAGGRYKIYQTEWRHGTKPPSLFSFFTDYGDELVVWSTNQFLNEKNAHEIAVRIGNTIGMFV